MPISVECDCGKKLRAKDDYAGRVLKCPGCGDPIKVPIPTELAVSQFELDDDGQQTFPPLNLGSEDPFSNSKPGKPEPAEASFSPPVRAKAGGSREWIMWSGLAASLAVVALALVLFLNKQRRDAANGEVLNLMAAAKIAVNDKRWDDAIASVKLALGVRDATEKDEATRYLAEVEKAKAADAADNIFKSAMKAVEAKRFDEAVRLFVAYQSHSNASNAGEAGKLVEAITLAASDLNAVSVLQQLTDGDLEVLAGSDRIVGLSLPSHPVIRSLALETLRRNLPDEAGRRQGEKKRLEQERQDALLAEQIKQQQEQNAAAEKERLAAREQQEAAARQQQALAHPMPVEFNELITFPERFRGRAVYLNRVLILSDLERSTAARCFGLGVRSNGKFVNGVVKTFGGEKTFVMSEKMGEKFSQTFDQGGKYYEARLLMTVDQYGPEDNPKFTYFNLYRIDIYQQLPVEAYQQGRILASFSN